jgi:hypothetical protein
MIFDAYRYDNPRMGRCGTELVECRCNDQLHQNMQTCVTQVEKYAGSCNRRRLTTLLCIAPARLTPSAFYGCVVSMVDGHLFDTIAAIANQLCKKTDRPFGGIQVGSIYISC